MFFNKVNKLNISAGFGERIRTVRKNAGCSQKEFCSVLGIPQSTLSAYETNRILPTIVTLMIIATEFDVTMDWLCGIEKHTLSKAADTLPCFSFSERNCCFMSIDESKIIRDIYEFIVKNDITEFYELTDYAYANNREWFDVLVTDKHTIFFNTVIKSRND